MREPNRRPKTRLEAFGVFFCNRHQAIMSLNSLIYLMIHESRISWPWSQAPRCEFWLFPRLHLRKMETNEQDSGCGWSVKNLERCAAGMTRINNIELLLRFFSLRPSRGLHPWLRWHVSGKSRNASGFLFSSRLNGCLGLSNFINFSLRISSER